MTSSDDMAREAGRIARQIYPLLHGRPPELQGAVLADLIALWIAGHHPELRNQVFDDLIDCARQLVPICEAQLLERLGTRPEGW